MATAKKIERQADLSLADFRIVVGWILCEDYQQGVASFSPAELKRLAELYHDGASANTAAKKIAAGRAE